MTQQELKEKIRLRLRTAGTPDIVSIWNNYCTITNTNKFINFMENFDADFEDHTPSFMAAWFKSSRDVEGDYFDTSREYYCDNDGAGLSFDYANFSYKGKYQFEPFDEEAVINCIVEKRTSLDDEYIGSLLVEYADSDEANKRTSSAIIGFMIEHTDGDKEFWNLEVSAEDQKAIYEILAKYDSDEYDDSLRGDLKVIESD